MLRSCLNVLDTSWRCGWPTISRPMIAGVVGANNATAGIWRAGSGTFQPSNDGEIGSADGGAGYLGRGSNQGKPLSHRFVGEEAVSALTGLHCKTKLRSTAEADSVPTSQCKRDVMSVRERPLMERHPTAKTPLTTRKEKQVLSRARQVARSKKRGARSKDSLQDGARWTGHSQHGTAGSRRGIWDT